MQQIHSIILAGGLSTRMGSAHTNKVCLELCGKPMICRALEAIRNAGITSHTIVLGSCAGKVMECLRDASGSIAYAWQPRQRGAGDALRCAVKSLPENLPADTLLLVTPGHRIIAEKVINDLLYFYSHSNLAMTGARLHEKSGHPRQDLAIYVMKYSCIAGKIRALENSGFFDSGSEITLNDLARELNKVDDGFYLDVENFADVLGFNNPGEFLEAAELLHYSESLPLPDDGSFHTIKDWLSALQNRSEALEQSLAMLYGSDSELALQQSCKMQQMLETVLPDWGSDAMISIIRSPGRVNVMGRHVDHQGGNCNLMTIGYETLMLVRRRNDDKVTVKNLNGEFAPAEFSIGELVNDLPWDDWQTLVTSKKLTRLLKQYGVNWADYIKAVFLRFQKHFYNRKLCGLDMLVSGNVPMAAGLSSSSTLVVGTAEAVTNANRLDLQPDKLITLCGEGEWFVGTRGGAADHAAVKMGECNKVVKVGFFDFKVEKMVDFPDEYALIVADSNIKARKSSNAKDQFNHRVSCYRIGLLLLKKFFPQYASRVQHLRDFSCKNLGIPLDWFYKLMTSLPENATRQSLEAMLPECDLSVFWNNHAEPADKLYNIRSVVLYGLAECERSAAYADRLAGGDIANIGEMMNISHNGDRVMSFAPDGSLIAPYFYDCSDHALQKLIDDLHSGDKERIENAQLWRQPGGYRCSLPEIDRMVDLARSVPGVAGAQLAGAGLGGCMMVLLHRSSIDDLTRVLDTNYYRPLNIAPSLLQCRPIAGAGAVKF